MDSRTAAARLRPRFARAPRLGPLVASALAAVVLASGCAVRQAERAAGPSARVVELRWGVVPDPPAGRSGFVSELVLHNRGERPLPAAGWTLFFNFGPTIDAASVTPSVRIQRIHGDFYRLSPSESFRPLAPGDRTRITFRAEPWAISETDAPDGFYFVWGDEETGRIDPIGSPAILPFSEASQTRRGAADALPVETPQIRFADNAGLHELPEEEIPRILPRPSHVSFRPGTMSLDRDVDVAYAEGLEGEAAYLADLLEELLGARPVTSVGSAGRIVLATDDSLPPEAYRLRVDDTVRVAGGDAAGVFYGIQSLRSLVETRAETQPAGRYLVPHAVVDDAPRFPYRGMHLDVARNFQSVAAVERLLDLMARYKLNRFHLHLADDEGWRVAIEELPELSAVGGHRGHTLSEAEHLAPTLGSGPYADRPPGSGFYTRQELEEILRHAHRLHVEVIPEIDLPGHSRAAIVAMEARSRRTGDDTYRLVDPLDTSEYESVQGYDDDVVDVCRPAVYRFLATVVGDLAQMYREAGVPFRAFHVGGDEVPEGAWERSPACAALIRQSPEIAAVSDLHDYFLRRVDAILDRHGLVTAGWEEIALASGRGEKRPNPAFVGAGLRPYVWSSVWGWGSEETAYELANAGYDVVLANASELYFDFAYAKHPQEPGFYWAGFVDTRRPFAFAPFDLYRSADHDLMGRPIAPDTYAEAERLTAAGRRHVRGLQGQLWGETIKSPERLEYMVFPRLIALAERAWADSPPWAEIDDPARRAERRDEDWNVFANALARRELPRLDRLGIRYRIPPPGAVIRDGVLSANTALPGLAIRYTTDGSEPSSASALYTGPRRVRGPVKLRTFATNGRGSRTVSLAP